MKVFKKKLKNKETCIGIIGLGYVGIPLVLRFAEENYKVIGFDIDHKKVSMLNSGISYFSHIESIKIKNALDKGFSTTLDFSLINNCDVIIICVPTPLKAKIPDLSFIYSTLKSIKSYIKRGQLLILESTT